MVRGQIKSGALCALMLATLLLPFQVCAQLQVMPARNSIGADDTLQVEIKLLDGNADTLDLTPLEHDFDIVGQGRGSQVNIINGNYSKINTWSLRLLPKRSGKLMLPQLCAGSSCSEPIVITVSSTQSAGGDSTLILEHGSLPERVFVGQQVLYKMRLLYRTTLHQAVLSPPVPEGVECEVVKLGEDVRSEIYQDGWRYEVIERNYVLIPQRSGTLQIPPVMLEAEVGGSRERGFDPFGGRGQLVRRRSAAAEILVEPPARTEHAWIPAQTLEVEDSWGENPPQLRVGEPSTRTITVQANGTTASRLDALELDLPPEFRVYPDQVERENILSANSELIAQMRQSIAIVPREAGTFTLPAITFIWWDMRAQRWSTTEIEAQEVTVLPVERAVQIADQRMEEGAAPRADRDGVGLGPDTRGETKQAAVPQTQTETKPAVDTLRWQLATAICAGGWSVSLLLWWRSASKRRRVSRQKTSGEDCPQPNLARLEHTLLQAAQQREPKEARHQLQQWAACLYPASATPLDTLMQQGSEAMTTALAELNAALYAEADSTWDGAALAQAVRAHAREWKDGERGRNGHADHLDKAAELPPLYPQV